MSRYWKQKREEIHRLIFLKYIYFSVRLLYHVFQSLGKKSENMKQDDKKFVLFLLRERIRRRIVIKRRNRLKSWKERMNQERTNCINGDQRSKKLPNLKTKFCFPPRYITDFLSPPKNSCLCRLFLLLLVVTSLKR